MKRMTKVLTIGILIALLISFLPIPVHINRTISGIGFWQEKADEVTEEEIQIKGWYYRYLFRDNVFCGDIHIDSLDPDRNLLLDRKTLKVIFHKMNYIDGRYGTPTYYNISSNKMENIGSFIVKGNFAVILVEASEEGHFMAFPAENREDAVSTADKLMRE